MQIRIGLIPLITSTFVFYTWELPGNAAIRIFMFLSMKHIFENTHVKPSFKVTQAVRYIICNGKSRHSLLIVNHILCKLIIFP
jgi:hypothetical protein